MIIRADKAFFEAMREAGFDLDLPKLALIYTAAKGKRKPKGRADTWTLDMFAESAAPQTARKSP